MKTILVADPSYVLNSKTWSNLSDEVRTGEDLEDFDLRVTQKLRDISGDEKVTVGRTGIGDWKNCMFTKDPSAKVLQANFDSCTGLVCIVELTPKLKKYFKTNDLSTNCMAILEVPQADIYALDMFKQNWAIVSIWQGMFKTLLAQSVKKENNMGLDSSLYKTKEFWGIGEKYDIEVRGKSCVNDSAWTRPNNKKAPTHFEEKNLEYFSLTTEVAYWRKCNQIHKWFVTEHGGGKDDCQRIPVTREDLQTLLNICKEIKENPAKAQSLLPTQGGFFFGPTEYDEYYFTGIDSTIEQLTEVLKEPDDPFTNYYYQASW